MAGADDPGAPRRAGAAVRRGAWAALLPLLVASLGLWVFWPSLGYGLHLDDYLHLAEVQGLEPLPEVGPLELFTFAEPPAAGAPERMGPVQGDLLPWWTQEGFRVRFGRPLASLAYHLDHALFGARPDAYHRTNLVLWALLCLGVGLLYRELAGLAPAGRARGAWTALLAGAFFAFDRAHEGNVAWIAGRYSLAGALTCAPALVAYHRYRGGGRAARRWLAATLALLALGLASSETALGFGGFALAYELGYARDRWLDRARALAPVAALLLAYVVLYGATGHGVAHSSWYVDPLARPGAFVAEGLNRRLPQLARDALIAPEWFALHHPDRLALPWLAAGGVLSLLVGVMARDRVVRFLALGALLALLPQAAAPVQPRSLLVPSIGTAWALAACATALVAPLAARSRALLRGRLPGRSGSRRGPAAVAAGSLALLGLVPAALLVHQHLAVEPPLARAFALRRELGARQDRERALAAPIPDGEEARDARVLLLTSPSGDLSCYLPVIRLFEGRPWPGALWALSSVRADHELARVDGATLELSLAPAVRGPRAGFLATSWARLFRDDLDVREGERFRRGELAVEIAAVEDGRVRAVRASFGRDLDDPSVWLLAWSGGRWVRVAPPDVGERLALPRAPR